MEKTEMKKSRILCTRPTIEHNVMEREFASILLRTYAYTYINLN